MATKLSLFLIALLIVWSEIGMSENDTIDLIDGVSERGPVTHMEVFDPETNITSIWDMNNGTSKVKGNTIKQKLKSDSSSSSSSEEKKD